MRPSSLANLKKFKPGQSGNPTGAGRWPKELQNLRSQSKQEVVRVVSRCMLMSKKQLKAMALNPDATVAEILVASIISKAIETGCPIRSQFLFNYVLGKPKPVDLDESDQEPVEQDVVDAIPSPIIIDILRAHAASAGNGNT